MMKTTDFGQVASSALQSLLAQEGAAAARERTVYTLQAMNQLARYLAVLPGHKNLIWFSGSFPLNVMPNNQLSDPFMLTNDFRDAVRQTADIHGAGTHCGLSSGRTGPDGRFFNESGQVRGKPLC